MLIAIIDRDQRDEKSDIRVPMVVEDEDGNVMTFESIEDIRDLCEDSLLNVFRWWAFDLDTGEAEEV
ncbi:MAG: hypothetical protein JSU85_04855 [Candidatus Zixiibacteriota bacterium]|nr:MAG: hypothetical protein JSU85_04855 [candidate division Zixibacteria bacterium]